MRPTRKPTAQKSKEIFPAYPRNKNEYGDFRKYALLGNIVAKVFEKVTQIPNVLKHRLEEDRQLIIRKMDQRNPVQIQGYVQSHHKRMELSPAGESIKMELIYPNGKRKATTLQAGTTMTIQITPRIPLPQIAMKAISSEANWLMIELVEREQTLGSELFCTFHEPLGVVNEELSNPEKCCSFLRKSMTSVEIKDKTVFLHVHFAKPQYGRRKLPLAIQLLDYNGKELIDIYVTPRMRVARYWTEQHGVSEEHVINQMDEAEARNLLYQAIQGMIVVGHRVLETLKQCSIRPHKVCGIRDVANTITLDRYIKRKHQKPLTLPEIHRIVTERNPTKRSLYVDMPSLQAKLIKDIYDIMRPHWKDHQTSQPEEPNQLYPSFRKIHKEEEKEESIDLQLQEEDEFLNEANQVSQSHFFPRIPQKLTIDERIQQMLLEGGNTNPLRTTTISLRPSRVSLPITQFEPLTHFEEIPKEIRTLSTPSGERYRIKSLNYQNEQTGSPLTIIVDNSQCRKPYHGENQ